MSENKQVSPERYLLTKLLFDVRFKPMTNEERTLMHVRIRELSAILGIEEEKKK